MTDDDLLSPQWLTGLELSQERLEIVANEFAAIRTEIEKLRQLNLDETHPAVVFKPVLKEQKQ